jgi:hypothetical protein
MADRSEMPACGVKIASVGRSCRRQMMALDVVQGISCRGRAQVP